MPIAAPNLFRGVTDDIVNKPLIDSGRCQSADETVPENVQSANDVPFGFGKRALDVIVALIHGERANPGSVVPERHRSQAALRRFRPALSVLVPRCAASLAAAGDFRDMAEQRVAAGMNPYPIMKRGSQEGRKRCAPG